MSFGNSWIAGTHVLNKDKMSKRRNTSAQNIQSCVTPTKRATRQSKSTNKARHRHTYKGGPPTSHLAKAGGQRRQCGAGRIPGSAEPVRVPGPLSFGRKVATAILTSVTSVPALISPGNRPLHTIKGPPHTHSRHSTHPTLFHHIHKEEK